MDAVVLVVGFTALLWWIPKTEMRLMPALCAWIFAPYWAEAAFVGYVTALFFGTLYTIVEGTGVFSDGTR